MTTVPEHRDANQSGVLSGHAERLAPDAEPSETERAMPVQHSDQVPGDPAQFDRSTTEALEPRGTDEVEDDRRRAEREIRRDLAAASDDVPSAGDEAQSSYSTEREQGAAQPGSAARDADDRSADEGPVS
jgi:hypothetical protein